MHTTPHKNESHNKAPTTSPGINVEMAAHLQILLETPDLIAVYKPSGIHSAPLRSNETSTILNAVVTLYPECAEPVGTKTTEGTLLHRLDQGTSGVLLFARSKKSFKILRGLWSERCLEKDYLAWVDQKTTLKGTLTCELAHSPKSTKKMIVVEAQPAAMQRQIKKTWPAITSFSPLVSTKNHTLMAIRIHTGVMHQVRVTLSTLGAAVLSDKIYKSSQKQFKPAFIADINGLNSLVRKLVKSPQIAKARPIHEVLPENGFFLHAFRIALKENMRKKPPVTLNELDPSTIKALKNGIYSQPPHWFGLNNLKVVTD